MKINSDLEFAWKNAFRPTPTNVQLFLRGSRRVLAAIGGTSFIVSKSGGDPSYDWVLFWLAIVQVVLEEVAAYIGEVTKPGIKEVLKIEGDKKAIDTIIDSVKISTETVKVTPEREDSEG